MVSRKRTAHTIPKRPADEVLESAVLFQPEGQAEEIRSYVEWQAKEPVKHLEKVGTEYVVDRKIDAWDVRTSKDRYWVLTTPTNLYSQKLFPSLDYTISFHVGVTMRVLASQHAGESEEHGRFTEAFRKWLEADAQAQRAEEAEDFQAVGMRCREALLAGLRVVQESGYVSPPMELKQADFTGWVDHIANTFVAGPSNKELRGYVKATSVATWQLVSWLTHARNAVQTDASLALDATQSVIVAFSTCLMRHELGPLERCPNCRSYKLKRLAIAVRGVQEPMSSVCDSCGWTSARVKRAPSRKRTKKMGN